MRLPIKELGEGGRTYAMFIGLFNYTPTCYGNKVCGL